jgi:hypothetical protein
LHLELITDKVAESLGLFSTGRLKVELSKVITASFLHVLHKFFDRVAFVNCELEFVVVGNGDTKLGGEGFRHEDTRVQNLGFNGGDLAVRSSAVEIRRTA